MFAFICAYIVNKLSYASYFYIGDNVSMKFDDKLFIAEKIKTHRKKKGLTQEQLAELIDLSVQHVSRIENGCYIPSLTTFFSIIKELDIDLREFGFNIEKNKNKLVDELINIIINAKDEELVFYKNMINSIKNSFSEIKKN